MRSGQGSFQAGSVTRSAVANAIDEHDKLRPVAAADVIRRVDRRSGSTSVVYRAT
jgi:hypothetical protein